VGGSNEGGSLPRAEWDESRSPEWALVMRVASSDRFKRTPRLREVLLYTARHALQGSAEDLHEQEIGVRVFGKPEGYDTGVENTVRVSVSQLRRRLALYFATEGTDSPVVIEIPPGTYRPIFRVREERQPATSTAASHSSPEAVPPRWLRAIPLTIVGILISALFVLNLWLWHENSLLKSQTLPLAVQDISVQRLWSAIFSPEARTDIVVADSGLALIQDVTGEVITLHDYVNGLHFDRLERSAVGRAAWPLVDRLSHRAFTSGADVHLSLRIALLNRHQWRRGAVRTAKDLTTRDFSADNFVLLGSRRSNPWVELFEPLMNFRVEFDAEAPGPFVHNIAPRSDEEEVYRPSPYGQPQSDLYAVVALLPNLQHTGRILIIAGTGMEATESAGDFLTRDSLSAEFLRRIGFGRQNSPTYFEAVVHSRFAAGAGVNPKVVAYRVIENPDPEP
jgi:hypothetical protein